MKMVSSVLSSCTRFDSRSGRILIVVVVHIVLQTVQRYGVYSGACGTVHYRKPLKSFEIRVGHGPGFGLSSVAILLRSPKPRLMYTRKIA